MKKTIAPAQARKVIKLCLCYSIIACLLLTCDDVWSQEVLYPNEFPLKDVVLLDGPFKHARDLNIQTLLKYDTDRLLAPFLKEAGLPPKGKLYPNWEGLDGHVGGHYLSAMAMNYAATGNFECRKRMEYMISELKNCQDASEINNPGWGKGYIGGVPNSKNIWSTLQKGDFKAYRSAWVPWYNVHKLYAGLRDAWVYAGNKDAKVIFLKFCDWGINITAQLTDTQMQTMLDSEHGGINEIFADAYQITSNVKYLTAAKRFSHLMLLDPMSSGVDNLDNKHANTQVPKAIGFQRTGELSKDEKFLTAGKFFWETVTTNRSLAFGGNSRREFFPSTSAYTDFINDIEGPESCNSFNMLRLTENIFRTDPQAKYTDYYERTLYNHILSTQHPEHGGYVYFTPARPRHYRVYSAPNEGMWCCVGSGMENHGKYNQFIYTNKGDSLYLNLFIASELNWREKGIKIRQETIFPDEEQTKITIVEGNSKFKLMVRYPSWVKEGTIKISINGKPFPVKSLPGSYVTIDRNWKRNDKIVILLPMHNSIEHLPNVPEYIAFMHGPILLGAKSGTEDLKGLIADDSRWGHIPGGQKLPVDKAPVLVENDISDIAGSLVPVANKPLTFTLSNPEMINPSAVELMPFYRIHDSRYIIYWMALSEKQSRSFLDSLAAIEKVKIELQKRTVDFVAPGEQQPEADHKIQISGSNSGNTNDRFWRDARNEGFFSYEMTSGGEQGLNLLVTYRGGERGNRKFDIYIDNGKLISEDNTGKWNQNGFQDVEYSIPDSMINGKSNFRIRFQSLPGASTSQVFYIRLVTAIPRADL
jgi:DUF1680 family protein